MPHPMPMVRWMALGLTAVCTGCATVAPEPPSPVRTRTEIQRTFEHDKEQFMASFTEYARHHRLDDGEVVLAFTVGPDGHMTECRLVSSTFHAPALEAELLKEARSLDFGARDVPVFTYADYPIKYFTH